MRAGVAALLVMSVACGPSGHGPISPSSTAPPAPAALSSIAPFAGSYALDGGDTVVIARMGWYFDLGDASYRTLYATGTPAHFTIGPGFEVPLPKFADLSFSGVELTVHEASRTRTGRRIAYRQTDVSIPSGDAQLAATITEPDTPAPHAGIVVVHGAEPGQRFFYDVWVGIYASLGLAVLAYDKRGIGSSTGNYPGERPTDAALSIYSSDAEAAREFLARWPGVDARRVGFHGGSQGGWTVPLAIDRFGGAAFAVLMSAPATTVEQTDLWASFSQNGEYKPSESNDAMLTAVRSASGGYDPAPAIARIRVPILYVLGTNDRTVPTAVCVEILDAMHKRNVTVQTVQTGHGLLVNATGLAADDSTSPGLAPELVPVLREWLPRAASS